MIMAFACVVPCSLCGAVHDDKMMCPCIFCGFRHDGECAEVCFRCSIIHLKLQCLPRYFDGRRRYRDSDDSCLNLIL
jgi:hypothetical protein